MSWWTIAAIAIGILWYFHGARVVRERERRRLQPRYGRRDVNVHITITIRKDPPS